MPFLARLENPLRLVKPQTVIGWRWKSRRKDDGRPNLPFEVIHLIRRMSLENPLWGAPRIHGELIMLGYDVSESTVAKYMVKRRGRPTQNWKTFLHNHLGEIAAIDFLTVPMINFNVTTSPTADWTALQLLQAFPFDSAPKYLIRDRDGIYGEQVQETIKFLGMKDKMISARSPWQNGYCERVAVGGLHSRYYRDAA